MKKDLIVVGVGPAAMAAGMYAEARFMVETLIVGDAPGGTMTSAGKVENYPGVESIEGLKLFRIMQKQAEDAGAEIVWEKIIEIKKEKDDFSLKGEINEYRAKAVIYAAGNEWRKLGLPNEKEFTGKGLHYCAVCDGPLYRNKVVAVVGGGNSAAKAANLIAEYASKVYLITTGKELTAEPANLKNVHSFGEKIEIFKETNIKELKGGKKLEAIFLEGGRDGELKVDALFVEIGLKPNIQPIKDLNLVMDEKGYLKVDSRMATNIPGFFAAGDVTDFFGNFRQIITAAAMGAAAANSAYEYLAEKKND